MGVPPPGGSGAAVAAYGPSPPPPLRPSARKPSWSPSEGHWSVLIFVYQAVAKLGWARLEVIATWKLIELKRLFCSKKGRVSATQLTPLLLSWSLQPLFAALVTPV